MAKSKVDVLDFTNNPPDWAAGLRQDFLRRKQAEGKVNSALQAAIDEGLDVDIADEDYEKAVQDVMAGREFNLRNRPADFTGVTGTVDTTEQPVLPRGAAGRTALDKTGTALGAGLGDIAADVMFRDIDAEAAEKIRKADEDKRINESVLPKPLATLLYKDYLSPVVAKASQALGDTEAYRGAFGSLSEYVANARKEVEAEAQAKIEDNAVQGYVERAVLDVAGSPQSLASIPGGLFAGIPAATTYNDNYRAAREAGLSPKDAGEYATSQAAVEGGISAIPTGKLFKVLGGRQAAGLATRITGRGARTLATAAGESAEEMAQQLAQEGVNRAFEATADDDVTRAFAKGQQSADVLDSVLRAGAAGALGGTAFGGIQAAAEFGSEISKQAQETTEKAKETSLRELRAQRLREQKADTEVTMDIAAEEQKIRTSEEFNKAYEERQREQAVDEQRKADEEEAGFRTMEQLREFGQPERVERYADVVERTPIQPPAEITPEQITAEREAAAAAEPAPVKKPRKPKAVKKQAVKPVEIPITKEVPKPTVSDKKLNDNTIADLSARLNLGMQEEAASNDSVGYDEDAFIKKSANIIKNVTKKNRQDTADVQNLLRQGKLVLAPNAESIGREPSKNVAEYDTGTGKMYLYTDRVDAKDVAGVMARALHESTHAGQFNDRAGRPSLFKQMMSATGENKASKAILKAAEGGNVMAKRAVEKAMNASPDMRMQDLELVPYFVTEAAKARGTMGSLRSTANDIVASARTFMRDKLGLDLDVSMGDLEAAAQQTAGEIVKTNVKPRATGETLGMVLGPQAKGFKKAKAEGKTYSEAADQGERFEISDADSELGSDAQLEELIPFGPKDKQSTTMENILSHDKLYNEYPWLADYKVSSEYLGPEAYGLHDPNKKEITINEYLFRSAVYATTPEARQSAKERIRNTLLHEVQHAIQAREGFVAGANQAEFIPQSVINDKTRAENKLREVVKNFDLGRAINTLDPAAKKAWENEVKATGVVSRDAMSALFLDEGYYDDVSDRMLKRFGETTYQNAVAALSKANYELRKAEDKAFRTYLRDQGEFEARGTEARSKMTQTELEAKPRTAVTEPDEGGVTREQTINTRPLASRRVPAESRSLGMAENYDEDVRASWLEKNYKKVPPIVKSLIDSSQGTGRQINEVVEHAASAPAGATMQAEAYLGKFNRAVDKLATEQGVSPVELAKQIAADLDKVDAKSNSYEQNRAEFAAVAAKYGKAGEALMQLRDQIDQLTLDIVRQRAQDDTPLTEKEKKLYKTLLSNMGRYAHRQYAVNAGKAGSKYAEKVWKDYEKVKAGSKRTNPAMLDNYNKVAAAVRYLVDNNLNIPNDEDLANLGTEQVQSLYDTWGKYANRQALTADEMRAELSERRDAINDNGNLEKRAEETTKELLGLKETFSPTASYFRGGKEDTGFLQERTNIPKELRTLMGEITDPGMRLLATAAKQAEFVARNKMLLELRGFAGGLHVQAPDAKASATKGMEQLKGEAWGPMEGYYVSPEMRNRIGDVMQTLATFEQAVAMASVNPTALNKLATSKAMETWSGLAAASKGMQIVYNPMNFLYNFIGAPRMMLLNGNADIRNIGKALNTSFQLIQYAANPAKASPEAMRMNKMGITDSAFIGEIKSAKYQQLGDLINQMSKGEGNKTLGDIAAFGRKAKLTAKETYAMMDVWSKISNFYQQVDVLTDFYNKEGIDRTPEQIDREAADIVNRTNITYKRAAPLVKAMERGGLTQFGTYFYEVFRSEISNAMQGIAEIKRGREANTPEGRNAMIAQGTKRLVGQATVWTLTGMLSNYLGGMFGDDDDERKQKRALLPEYMRNQDFFTVGKDEKGNDVMFNVSRFDSAGPITDIMRSIMHEDASAEQVGKNIFDLYVAPRLGTQMITALQVMAGEGPSKLRKPTSQQVAPDVYGRVARLANDMGIEDRTTKAWANVVETFLPGMVNAYRDTNALPVPNDPQSAIAASLAYMGNTMYKMDPAASAKFLNYGTVLKNERRDLANIGLDYPDGIPENELISRVITARERELEAFADMQKVYDGMRATGMSKRKALAVLKDNVRGISQETLNDVGKGRFDSQVVSKSSLDRYMKDEMKGKDKQEQKEIKRKWNELYKMLYAADKQIDEGEE